MNSASLVEQRQLDTGFDQQQYLRLDIVHQTHEIQAPLLTLLKQPLDEAHLYAYRDCDSEPVLNTEDDWCITALIRINSNQEAHDLALQIVTAISPFPADLPDPEVFAQSEFEELQVSLSPFRA